MGLFLASRRAVSTHSRLKAAGSDRRSVLSGRICFNTQPPKGGWRRVQQNGEAAQTVSTHSRLKAAGNIWGRPVQISYVSTHSRLKAAGLSSRPCLPFHTRFNTQPPKGGWIPAWQICAAFGGFNTQPPKGGWGLSQKPCSIRFRSPDFAKLPKKARTRV